MYCIKCGTQLNECADFCHSCGFNVVKDLSSDVNCNPVRLTKDGFQSLNFLKRKFANECIPKMPSKVKSIATGKKIKKKTEMTDECPINVTESDEDESFLSYGDQFDTLSLPSEDDNIDLTNLKHKSIVAHKVKPKSFSKSDVKTLLPNCEGESDSAKMKHKSSTYRNLTGRSLENSDLFSKSFAKTDMKISLPSCEGESDFYEMNCKSSTPQKLTGRSFEKSNFFSSHKDESDLAKLKQKRSIPSKLKATSFEKSYLLSSHESESDLAIDKCKSNVPLKLKETSFKKSDLLPSHETESSLAKVKHISSTQSKVKSTSFEKSYHFSSYEGESDLAKVKQKSNIPPKLKAISVKKTDLLPSHNGEKNSAKLKPKSIIPAKLKSTAFEKSDLELLLPSCEGESDFAKLKDISSVPAKLKPMLLDKSEAQQNSTLSKTSACQETVYREPKRNDTVMKEKSTNEDAIPDSKCQVLMKSNTSDDGNMESSKCQQKSLISCKDKASQEIIGAIEYLGQMITDKHGENFSKYDKVDKELKSFSKSKECVSSAVTSTNGESGDIFPKLDCHEKVESCLELNERKKLRQSTSRDYLPDKCTEGKKITVIEPVTNAAHEFFIGVEEPLKALYNLIVFHVAPEYLPAHFTLMCINKFHMETCEEYGCEHMYDLKSETARIKSICLLPEVLIIKNLGEDSDSFLTCYDEVYFSVYDTN